MSFCAYLSKDLTQQHHSMGSLYFCVYFSTLCEKYDLRYLFDGKHENSDAIRQSVDGKPKNFSTICSNKLRNCQLYGLQRWTLLKVHFLVMLGFLWLIVYCKRYWFQRLTLWLLHGRAHAHEPITFTINSQSRVRVRVISFFFSENQKIIMEQKYEKFKQIYTPIW